MARRTHTVGIIGLGFGRAHIPAFQANGCQVVAVCQRNAAQAKAVADKYGIPRVFERWEEMLAEAKPEIVVIAAPPHLHHAIALRAFAAGAHVLCEKPLAMTRAEARAMVEAAAHARRVAMTGFNWRFPAAMQRLHAMVEEGFLGTPFHASLRYLVPRWVDEATPPTWRMDRAQAGHGAMGDLGVHLVDLARWNFGEIVRVSARAGIAYPSRTVPGGAKPADAEDFCAVTGELASGALVTLMVSRAARGGNEQTLEAYGSHGAFSYRLARSGARWYKGELRAAAGSAGFEPVKVPATVPRSVGEGDQLEVTGKATIGPLVKRFLAGIRKGETPSPSFEDGLRAQAVLDAVLESASRGGWVDVPRD
ncbi:MAG: Gfo/Idh/MocA family oxidoreductase [Candidatus Rokubacteria bacterium]|nr:Gfo/Idh/MocA family oxidoreductase [Candidatus Rokubacteria bacterium]